MALMTGGDFLEPIAVSSIPRWALLGDRLKIWERGLPPEGGAEEGLAVRVFKSSNSHVGDF
jgi:hypothetical protein